MTTETNETHVITELPAPKQKFRNPFTKKNDSVPTDTNDSAPTKEKKFHGVYAVGVLLLAAGAVGAVASRFGKNDDDEVDEVPSDNTDVA